MKSIHASVIVLCLSLSLASTAAHAQTPSTRTHIQTLLLAEPGAEQDCAASKGKLDGCAARLFAQAEQDLKNAETAAMAAMKRLDSAAKSDQASKTLSQEIKAYALYKVAHCNWIAASQAGSRLSCETDLNRARAHALSIYYTR
ncbi:lysozyme inhibitor LprI family protein [Chitinibacter sp. FCG-7]|uniref:Lysozyme inhibitor LprI family protein n=1 Tax=Chitinibacter mangrovi TaxID=3153927 RepID=A0AAU7F9J3_9NEIS